MAKTKSTSDYLLGSLRNTMLFGTVIGALGATIAFSVAPVAVWPVIAWAGLQAASAGALTYGFASLTGHAFKGRIDPECGVLTILATIGSLVYAGFSLIPGGNKKIDFGDAVEKTLMSTANASFSNDWKLAQKGLVVNINVPLGKTTVPMMATVVDKYHSMSTKGERDGTHVAVKTCLSFNTVTDKTARKPFNDTITICEERSLTDAETMRLVPGL